MKRGFTLIELLAVIVILAIIALIATPIILGIIKDARNQANQRSVELYSDAIKQAVARYNLNNQKQLVGTFEIENDGKSITNGLTDVTIDYSGSKLGGTVSVYEDGTVYVEILEAEGKPVEYKFGDKKPVIGAKYSIQVNATNTFDFYVLSTDRENETTTLIMDRNICEGGATTLTEDNNYCRYAWSSASDVSGEFGPVSSMQALYQATKGWTNIPNMEFNYISSEDYPIPEMYGSAFFEIITDTQTKQTTIEAYEGDTVISTSEEPLKARLPMLKDIMVEGICEADSEITHSSCANWLFENTERQTYICGDVDEDDCEEVVTDHGYWLITTRGGSMFAFRIKNGKRSISATPIYRTYYNGVRPVITVPNTLLN